MNKEKPKFIIDSMLGNLAKKLRVLGFDSVYFASIEDKELVSIAQNENRLILTKDRMLYKISQKQGIKSILLKGVIELDQFSQIQEQIHLENLVFDINNSRCISCNGKLVQIEKEEIFGKIPGEILERMDKFWICDNCKKVFWKGTHFKKLQEFADKLNAIRQ